MNEAFGELSPAFAEFYAPVRPPSPDQLLRTGLAAGHQRIRAERQLKERLGLDLLFRYFVGLAFDDPVRKHSTVWKNRDRVLESDLMAAFPARLLERAQVRRLLPTEHLIADRTLMQAFANMISFRPKYSERDRLTSDGSTDRGFRGERRSNATDPSSTHTDALLYAEGPGKETRLCYVGHVLAESRSALVVDAERTRAWGHAERLPALATPDPLSMLGTDRGLDVRDFVIGPHERWGTPRAPKIAAAAAPPFALRRPAIRAAGLGQRARRRIDEASDLDQHHRRVIRKPDRPASNECAGPSLLRPPRQLDPPTEAPGRDGLTFLARTRAGKAMAKLRRRLPPPQRRDPTTTPPHPSATRILQ